MFPVFECINDGCKRVTNKPNTICENCQREARILDHELAEQLRLERQNVVYKNEGLRRHNGRKP